MTLPDDGGPSAFDRAIADPIHAALDARPSVYETLVVPSNGYVLLPLLVLACVWFARRGDLRRAATMLVVPELAVAINTWLLKPLWGRQWHDYLAYPSGHTVHLVAIAATFALLADPADARRAVCAVAGVAMLAAAVGMVGLGYHHATDILGGVAAAITMAISLCWAAEILGRAKARRHATDTRAS